MAGQTELSGNLARSKFVAEVGMGLAEMRIPGAGDFCVTLGDGTGHGFKPAIRLATGLIGLAHAVAGGDLEAAFVNPSGLLTQAYRGSGLFQKPLDVRMLACYPSWDRFACAVHPRTGLTSLQDLREHRYPLKLSVREDPTHATRVLIDQMLSAAGFRLSDIEAWGGKIVYHRRPREQSRIDMLASELLDAVFDEGIKGWFEDGLPYGYRPIDLGASVIRDLEGIGWRSASLPVKRYPQIGRDYMAIDFSGWALYTRASLPEETAYQICAAIGAHEADMPWESGTYRHLSQLGSETDSTPMDVPLHPGAAHWYAESGSRG